MLLRYGESSVELEEAWGEYDVLEAKGGEETGAEAASAADAAELLGRSLAAPVGAESFERVFGGADGVVIIVPDHTRYAALEVVLPEVLARLAAAGVKEGDVEILFAPGIHERQTAEQRRGLLGAEVAGRIRFSEHDANDAGACERIGETSRGTPVEINRKLLGREKALLVGAVGYHYFAGFGGGRKLVLPGCASRASCSANHMLVLGGGVRAGELAWNAVHEDMLEGCELVEPDFLINVLLDGRKRVVDVVSGDWRRSHEEACVRYRGRFSAEVGGEYDVVVVSCGGYPRDVNFIQAHKAIDMAFGLLKAGGTIVAVAKCLEGAGHKDFMPWFRLGGRAEMERELRRKYQIYGQTALATLRKSEAVDILLLSGLERGTAETMKMRAVGHMGEALEYVRAKHGSGRRTCVMPEGAAVLPVMKR
jgi:nickel-dependent lactate racemase